MLNENTISMLSNDDKIKMDQFVQENYEKLKKYACRICRNDKSPDAGEELLNDTLLECYEGRRMLNFQKSPLTYFFLLLKSVRRHKNISRQRMFETYISMGGFGEGASMEGCIHPNVDENMDHQTRLEAYKGIKKGMSPYERELLTCIEKGMATEESYNHILQTRAITWETHKVGQCRLIQKVQKAMQAQFPIGS